MAQQFVMAGVMGWPVAHSRSPAIHNHWIRHYGLNGTYGLFPVRPERLEAALRGLSALGMAGCNITLPHKIQAMQSVDHVDPLAQRMGAINLVVVQPDGALHGFNTDGYGFIQSLRDAKPDWRADAGPIVVLGGGGAARAIVLSLMDAGARSIRLMNRTRSKAQALADEFGPVISVLDWAERHDALAGAAMLVNSTDQGMHGKTDLSLRLDALPTDALVCDAIYIPLETSLLANARARGNLTVNGLGMLLNQARPAFKAWFGVDPEVSSALRQAVIATF